MMKKTILLLVFSLVLSFALTSCNLFKPAHSCENKCEECGKCTDAECTEAACADKCEGHEDAPIVDDPEPEMNFFQKIIAMIMDLINKLLAMFKK